MVYTIIFANIPPPSLFQIFLQKSTHQRSMGLKTAIPDMFLHHPRIGQTVQDCDNVSLGNRCAKVPLHPGGAGQECNNVSLENAPGPLPLHRKRYSQW